MTHISGPEHLIFHQQFGNVTTDEQAYENPHSTLLQPVFEKLKESNSTLVGMVHGIIPWDRYFLRLLPEGVAGIFCVLENTCGEAFTYMLNGTRVRLTDHSGRAFKPDRTLTNAFAGPVSRKR